MENNYMKNVMEVIEKEVQKRIASITRKYEELTEKYNKLVDKYNKLDRKYHAMCSRNGGLTACNNKLRRQMEEKDSKIAELKDQLTKANVNQTEAKANTTKIQNLEKEISRLHNHIKQVKEQRDFMYSEYEKEIANLKEQSKNSAKELNKDVAYYYYPTEASDISFATKKLMLDCKKLGIKNIDGKNFMDREIRTFLEYSDRFELFSKEDAIKIINNLGVR